MVVLVAPASDCSCCSCLAEKVFTLWQRSSLSAHPPSLSQQPRFSHFPTHPIILVPIFLACGSFLKSRLLAVWPYDQRSPEKRSQRRNVTNSLDFYHTQDNSVHNKTTSFFCHFHNLTTFTISMAIFNISSLIFFHLHHLLHHHGHDGHHGQYGHHGHQYPHLPEPHQ